MTLTPLEPWILDRIGYSESSGCSPRQALDVYQTARLQETVAYARRASPFYRKHLAGLSLEDPRAFRTFPFTHPSDLQADPLSFLCVSQSQVERVITLASSGTTAPPKRVFFTHGDLERTVDFFHHGMGTLVQPGQTVLILMPGEQPGSVGDLLSQGLARLGARAIVHGRVRDAAATLDLITREAVDCLVGLPVQVLALARQGGAGLAKGRLKSVLLSADHVPDAIVAALWDRWGVPVYNHYGMTETGLGGAVECACRCGYHLREADLLWEIVDPGTGRILAPGEPGEAVFTTLTREGMPLIRYRTGDLTRFLPEPCACGSLLHRMERVQGRLSSRMRLEHGGTLTMGALDEALFALPFLLDFQPTLRRAKACDVLSLGLAATGPLSPGQLGAVRLSLLHIPAIRRAVSLGNLTLGTLQQRCLAPVSGSLKRSIQDQREVSSC